MEIKGDYVVADINISIVEEHRKLEYMKELGTYSTLPESYVDDNIPLNLVCHSKRKVIENEQFEIEKAMVLPEGLCQRERKDNVELVGNTTDLIIKLPEHKESCVKTENFGLEDAPEKVNTVKRRKRSDKVETKLPTLPLNRDKYSKSKCKSTLTSASVNTTETRIRAKRKKSRFRTINKNNHNNSNSICKNRVVQMKECQKKTVDKKERSRYKDPKICLECDFSTFVPFQFHRHLQYHSRNEAFQCKQCTYSSHSKMTLWHHARYHHKKSYEQEVERCEGKDKSSDNDCFENKNADKQGKDLKILKTPKVLSWEKCSTCDFKTKHHRHLVSHMNHHSEQPQKWQCKSCNYSASTQGTVRHHTSFHHEKLFQNPGIICRETNEKSEMGVKTEKTIVIELPKSPKTQKNENDISNDNKEKRRIKKVQRYGVEVSVDTISILDHKSKKDVGRKLQKEEFVIESNSIVMIESQTKKIEIDLIEERKKETISPEVSLSANLPHQVSLSANLPLHKPAQKLAENDVLYRILTLGGTQSPNSNSSFLVPESIQKNVVGNKQEQTAEVDKLDRKVSTVVQNSDDKINESKLNSSITAYKSPLNVTLQPKAKERVIKSLYVCLKCPFQTSGKLESELHQENHFSQKDFSCMFCTFSDSSKEKLKEHCKLHFRNNHQFEFCFDNQCATQASKPRLTDLISIETDDSPAYQCRYCGISLPHLQLSKHEERHTEGCKYLFESHAKT